MSKIVPPASRMLRISRSETSIAFFEPGHRFGGRHDRLIWMSRIGGSGKLFADTETCRDEQKREEFLCHNIFVTFVWNRMIWKAAEIRIRQ